MTTKILISGVMTLRNGVRLGYPFLEAVLSALPLCDEFVVVEGYSDDDTWDWLERLQRKFPDKVVLHREHWPTGLRSGHAIGVMQTRALRHCRGKWIYLMQADEIMPPENIRPLREMCDPLLLLRRVRQPVAAPAAPVPDTVHLPVPPDAEADARDRRYARDLNTTRTLEALASFFFSSYQLDFVHWVGDQDTLYFSNGYRWAVRLARNRPGLYSGLDGWLLQGRGCYPIGVARLPHPIIHLPATFPVNFWRKTVNHAALYPNHAGVQAEAREATRKLAEYENGTLPPLPCKPPFPLPTLIAPLFGSPEYRIRPELLE